MSHSPGNRETEIKLAVPDAETGRRLLDRAGFRVCRPRVFEANTVFDTPEGRFRAAGTLLRLREVDGRGLLTYKGPATVERHKSREELEAESNPPQAVNAILQRLGFRPAFRYEKFRTEFTDGAGLATLDETPIGVFLELEGAPDWIDRAAAALGFGERDYINASYLRLYLDDCEARRIPPSDMVFPPAPGTEPSV